MIAYRSSARCLALAPLIALLAGVPQLATAQTEPKVGSGPIKLFQFDAPAEAPSTDSPAPAPSATAPSATVPSSGDASVPEAAPAPQPNARYTVKDLPTASESEAPLEGPALPPAVLPQPEPEGRSRVDGIEIRKLDTRMSGATGPLTPAEGGLGLDLWAGMTVSQVADMLPTVPAQYTSAVMRDLAARLLLSSAEPPSRLSLQASTAPQPDAMPADDVSLVGLRAERLYAMGEIEGLNRLLALFPSRRDDAALRRLRVDGLLLANDWQAACRPAGNALAQAPQDRYWQRTKIACDAVAGDETRAHLGLDILREGATEDDAAFAELVNGLLGLSAGGEEPSFSPLHLAMMDRLGLAPSPSFRAMAPEGWGGLFAALGALPLEERIPLAERAVANGSMAPDRLGALYLQPIFDPIALDDPMAASSGDMESWRAHALIYQAARRQSYPLLRTQLVTALIDRMARDGLHEAALRLVPALAEPIVPTGGLSWAAPQMARAYYLSGDDRAAESWRLHQQQTARLVTPLWPYLQIATGGRADPGVLSAWAAGLAPDERERLAGVAQSLIEAFHDRRLGLQPEGPRKAIQEAALAGRSGQTLLLILKEFGSRDLASLDVPALALAVGALNHLGYAREARALATEALVAGGV